jgi:hypothetical protein
MMNVEGHSDYSMSIMAEDMARDTLLKVTRIVSVK